MTARTRIPQPLTFLAILMIAASCRGQAPSLPPITAMQSVRGMDATFGDEQIHLIVCSDAVIHVLTRPDAKAAEHAQPWLLPAAESCPGAAFQFAKDDKLASITTAKVKVTLSLDKGRLLFLTAAGDRLLDEWKDLPRTYEAKTLNGEPTYEVEERFNMDRSEAIYGLGQHQSGVFNYRGSVIELGQQNTDIAIPFLVSTKGYAVFWNTAALTHVDMRFAMNLNFDSIAGDGVDFFFIYGPEMDALVHEYRNLTGHAPMLPRWAYGFMQSKDRYTSTDQMVAIANRYRAEHIPLDSIVQDWYWWKREGDPEFNENYHDVPAAIAKLHDEHVHTMISTWAILDPESATYKSLDAKGMLIAKAHIYDPSNPAAGALYFKSLQAPLLKQGWDAFWLDSAEPEEAYPHVGDAILRDKRMAIGSGALYTNIFPLLHSENIQREWKADTDPAIANKRTFILTRSSFPGQQRVGMTVWNGDNVGSFPVLRNELAGGLNYALSGMPYWTTDIGGYWLPDESKGLDPAFQELYLRWFQFGVFCPVFRTHGHRTENEMWSYPTVEKHLIEADKLRYRMLPYLYSLAWKVHAEDYTIQRPLVMDFRKDQQTWTIADQFLFGPALMVSPVLEAGATERRVYLPKGSSWYDFWTGAKVEGGRYVQAAAPLDHLPVYVRAGSILPMGPDEEYAGEKPGGPIDLRIYPGADAQFSLYSDEGDNYDYEQGAHTLIPITWSEADGVITIAARQGSYPGLAKEMIFRIHFPNVSTTINVTYTGAEITLPAPTGWRAAALR